MTGAVRRITLHYRCTVIRPPKFLVEFALSMGQEKLQYFRMSGSGVGDIDARSHGSCGFTVTLTTLNRCTSVNISSASAADVSLSLHEIVSKLVQELE